MATINEITNAAGYTGNAALGGYVPDAIAIDARPLELLASYTVAYNKIEREQRQKDAEKQATDLSNLAAIDFSKIDPKWRDELATGFSDIQKYITKNPDAFNYKDNPKGYFEYKRKYNELLQGTTSGKANQIILEKRNLNIKNETDIKEKVRMQKRLDEDVAKTGLNQMLPVEEAYNLTFAEPVSPALLQKTVIHLLPNGDIEKNFSMRDMGKINQQAIAFDMQNPLEPKDIKTTDEYIQASAAKKALMDDEQQAKNNKKSKSGNFAMGEIADQIFKNKAYRVGGLPDGEISMDLLLKDPRTANLANMIQSVNSQWADQKARVISGEYKDPTGQAVDLTQYYPIDVKNGIDGVELARMQMWINSAPETEKSKFTYTGDATKVKINNDDNATKLTIAREGQAGENYRKRLEESGKEGKAAAKTVLANGYNPMASIIASVGTVNTSVPISSLSLAQVGAINPNYLDDKGNVDLKKTKDLQISFGTDAKGNLAIYELNKDGKAKTKLSETKILSNASSWLVTKGKETKGQDAYAFTEDGFSSAIKGTLGTQKVEAGKKTPEQLKAEADALIKKYQK